ncbi:MAG TPA: FprA family A-type flavoprotein [Candidatus Avirikenella pullistercoris]|nr:FprA family A-type flavoprotein [Candidatus Avirikenella pullistercoris]
MFNNVKVSDKVYWLGVNDRSKQLFENMWPLPGGVSYNCYLIVDDKTALLDTVEMGSDLDFVGRVESILGGRELDYLIINHMEPDHSGEIKDILRRYPDVKIIGNNKTYKILEGYYGITENLQEVKDGDTLSLGHHDLRFVFTPWVHWPETMMTYDITEHILFSADAFGSFGTLDGGIFDDEVELKYYEDEMRRYYSNIVGKYSNMVQKAFAKLGSLKIDIICPLHGLVWRSNPGKAIEMYQKWSTCQGENAVVIIYASMYGNTQRVADYIARALAEQGVKDIRVYDVSKTHVSYLISEVWRCKGVILGSCAYNTQMHPNMEHLTTELEHYGVKNKFLGIFGSHSWNGGGVRNLMAFAETMGFEPVAAPVDLFGKPTLEKLKACDEIAVQMAACLKGDNN